MSTIKITTLFLGLTLGLFNLTANASDQNTESDIAKRLAPIGSTYLAVDIPSAPQKEVIPTNEIAAARSGEAVYNTFCTVCHATGVAGAPIKGESAAWAPRLANGSDAMFIKAMAGFNAMPAKGTCMDCTDDEIKSAIEFITQ